MEDDISISDSDDDATVNTHTIILKMVRRTKTKRDGQSETNREMEIMYSEHLDQHRTHHQHSRHHQHRTHLQHRTHH